MPSICISYASRGGYESIFLFPLLNFLSVLKIARNSKFHGGLAPQNTFVIFVTWFRGKATQGILSDCVKSCVAHISVAHISAWIIIHLNVSPPILFYCISCFPRKFPKYLCFSAEILLTTYNIWNNFNNKVSCRAASMVFDFSVQF